MNFEFYTTKVLNHNVIWGDLPEGETRGDLKTAIVKPMEVFLAVLVDIVRFFAYLFTCGTFHDGKADLLPLGRAYSWNAKSVVKIENKKIDEYSSWEDLFDAYEMAQQGSKEEAAIRKVLDKKYRDGWGIEIDSAIETTDCSAKVIKRVQYLLDKGKTLDGWVGVRALCTAAGKMGSSDLAAFLLENGVDVVKEDHWGCTILFRIAREENVNAEVIELLIKKGADPNAVSSSGMTPLFYAKSKEAIEVLIRNGANLEARNRKGEAVLCQKVKFGTLEEVACLVAAGAELDKQAIERVVESIEGKLFGRGAARVQEASLEREKMQTHSSIDIDRIKAEIMGDPGFQQSIAIEMQIINCAIHGPNFLTTAPILLKRIEESGMAWDKIRKECEKAVHAVHEALCPSDPELQMILPKELVNTILDYSVNPLFKEDSSFGHAS